MNFYNQVRFHNEQMTGKIIQFSDYRSHDCDRNFYELPLEDRFVRYKTIVHESYNKREALLEPFSKKESSYPKKRLTPTELTEELIEIVPCFKGQVVGRHFFPFVALHYIVEQDDMESLFGESLFGRYTGKVIGVSDTLLSSEHADLSGLVIVQARQPTQEKDRFIAAHEIYHSNHFHYPNGVRLDNYATKLKDTPGLTAQEIVDIMIGLDRAILLDEAGACVNAYDSLGDKQRPRFTTEYIQELKDSSRNMLGFKLDAARGSGKLDEETIRKINQHEQASMAFPTIIHQATQKLSRRLENPEDLEPLGYAMSYVAEALQILDFNEIAEGIESLCVDVIEPDRLNRSIFG